MISISILYVNYCALCRSKDLTVERVTCPDSIRRTRRSRRCRGASPVVQGRTVHPPCGEATTKLRNKLREAPPLRRSPNFPILAFPSFPQSDNYSLESYPAALVYKRAGPFSCNGRWPSRRIFLVRTHLDTAFLFPAEKYGTIYST